MNAIIFHGTMGSPRGNWFSWLSQELSKLGVNTCVPELPTPENQSLNNWMTAFNEQCTPLTERTILIGHSCGAVFCMRLLEKLSRPVAGTVLVAPPYKQIGMSEIDALNASFLDRPFDWQRIRANAGQLAYLMGDNDQYVPQEQLLKIAEELKVRPIIVSGGGHLNAETGYTSFPLLLELLTELVRSGKITTKWSGRVAAPLI